MIADCGFGIAECRRHRAEGIGEDDRGQRAEDRVKESWQRTAGSRQKKKDRGQRAKKIADCRLRIWELEN
jgi:hypothetical protein